MLVVWWWCGGGVVVVWWWCVGGVVLVLLGVWRWCGKPLWGNVWIGGDTLTHGNDVELGEVVIRCR